MRVRYSFSSRRTGHIEPGNQHKQAVPKIVQEVIRISDIILQVLDARFIEQTRNPEMESLILEQGKKLIFVINKADLSTEEEIQKKIQELKLSPYAIISCKSPLGRKNLRDRIKIEVKRAQVKHKKAHVGIIGYPNTGKSTLINVLVGGGRAQAAPEAGFTKGIHKIRFTKEILILDTPGVIPERDKPATSGENKSKTSQVGVRTSNMVKHPESLVAELFTKHPKPFQNFYSIQEDDFNEFMEKVGRKLGRIKKGNVVDTDKTSRDILKAHHEGKIKE